MPVGRSKGSSVKDGNAAHAARQSTKRDVAASSGRFRRWRGRYRARAYATDRDPTGRTHPRRAQAARRRARVLLRDLSAQHVHGPRHPGGDGPGQPFALGPRDRARDALPDRPRARPSWCAAGAARSSTWSSTSAAARRPSGEWEGFELTDENARMLYVPGRLRARLLRAQRRRRRLLQAGRATTPTPPSAGSSTTTPRWAIEWPLPVAELKPSQRDADAPTLAEMEPDLPFVYRA